MASSPTTFTPCVCAGREGVGGTGDVEGEVVVPGIGVGGRASGDTGSGCRLGGRSWYVERKAPSAFLLLLTCS